MKRLKTSKQPSKQPKKLPTARQVKIKRIGIVIAALLMLALFVYAEVIRPNQNAKTYTSRLEASSKPLQQCFEKLADTTTLGIYYAPDIPLVEKQQDARIITDEINNCRKELGNFDRTSQQLMQLHFAGYTTVYKDAKVSQRQATDVIGQSNDVMNQYASMATFLSSYYNHIEAFSSYTTALAADGSFFFQDRIQLLASQAKDLRARAAQIQALDSPLEFDEMKNATAIMLNTTAGGFEDLVVGYSQGNDFLIASGYENVDKAVAMYDGTVINMPFEQINKSYIPKQVVQLPGKVENLLAAESE